LFSTESFGLESTFTSPKDSSSVSAKLKFRLVIAPPRTNAVLLIAAGVPT
jgi:hypothetical protein